MNHVQNRTGSQYILALTLCIAGLLFYFSFLDSYHDWGDDFAQYILHAQNILEGKNYADTGYIFNPENAIIGPSVYPPVFPLLLCIPIGIFGMDIYFIKGLIALAFSLSLFIIFKLSLADNGRKYAIWLIPILGLNPFILKFLQEIMSDLPFILFLYLSLYFLRKQSERNQRQILYGILAGIFAGIAAGTRIPGYILGAVLLVYSFQNWKSLKLNSAIPLVSFLIISAALLIAFPDSGEGYPMEINMGNLITNTVDLGRTYFAFFGKGLFYLGWTIALASIFFILKGIIKTKDENRVSFFVFLILYLTLLLIWGMKGHGIRLLLPVIPILLIFFLSGVQSFAIKFMLNPGLVCSFVGLIILLNYYPVLVQGKHSSSEPGPYESNARQMFSAVKEIIPPDETVAFFKPRTMAYFSSRNSIGLDKTESLEVLLVRMQKRGVHYFVCSPFDAELIKKSCETEAMISTALWNQNNYKIFKIDQSLRSLSNK